MRLSVMSLNLRYGGRSDAAGAPEPRWPLLAAQINEVAPQILLVQEAHGWGADPRLQAAAEHDTGMRGLLAPSPSGAHTAVLYRSEVLRWQQWETKYAHETHHGFGVAVLTGITEPTVPLAVISAHLHPCSAQRATQEAQLMIARLYRYGGFGILGGDINHVPLGDPEPDWHDSAVAPYNRSSRTVLGADGELEGNRVVGETLHRGGLRDVAGHLAAVRGDRALLTATGKGGVRVDQFHITPPLHEAVVSYQRVSTHGSDHDAITMVLDTECIDTAKA